MDNHRYLLDTNIVSDLIKNPQGIVAQKIATLQHEDECCTSIIVACELRYGAQKKNAAKLTVNVNKVLDVIPVLPLEAIDNTYADLRLYLEQKGQPIGHNDLLIASHALSSGLTIVTANMREFSRIPDLVVENWLKA